jgi:hypothetical protein
VAVRGALATDELGRTVIFWMTTLLCAKLADLLLDYLLLGADGTPREASTSIDTQFSSTTHRLSGYRQGRNALRVALGLCSEQERPKYRKFRHSAVLQVGRGQMNECWKLERQQGHGNGNFWVRRCRGRCRSVQVVLQWTLERPLRPKPLVRTQMNSRTDAGSIVSVQSRIKKS